MQLEALLQGILRQEAGDRLPYAFYVDDRPLVEELGAHLHTHKVTEVLCYCMVTVLTLVCCMY